MVDIRSIGNGGNKLYALNRQTGEYLKRVSHSLEALVHSLVNDDAGNVLAAALTPYGGTLRIYSFKSLESV